MVRPPATPLKRRVQQTRLVQEPVLAQQQWQGQQQGSGLRPALQQGKRRFEPVGLAACQVAPWL
jgi:hypothetical protein